MDIFEEVIKDTAGDKDIEEVVKDTSGDKDIEEVVKDTSGDKDIEEVVKDTSGDKDIKEIVKDTSGDKDIKEVVKDTAGYKDIEEVVKDAAGDKDIEEVIKDTAGDKDIEEVVTDAAGGKDIKEIVKDTAGDKDIEEVVKDTSGDKDIEEVVKDAAGDKDIKEIVKDTSGDKDIKEVVKDTAGYKDIEEVVKDAAGDKDIEEVIKDTAGDKDIEEVVTDAAGGKDIKEIVKDTAGDKDIEEVVKDIAGDKDIEEVVKDAAGDKEFEGVFTDAAVDKLIEKLAPKRSYHDLFVDRPYNESGHMTEATIIDKLKFRTNVFQEFSVCSNSSDLDSDYENACESLSSASVSSVIKADPFDLLIAVLRKGDTSIKQEIFSRLLEQRYSVPLLFKLKSEDFLTNFTHALMFTKVKYSGKYHALDEDTSLPRVVFLSDCHESDVTESTDLAAEIFHCQFSSKESGLDDFSMMCELTVGFLGCESLCSEHPWMVMNVRGDYNAAIPYIKRFKPDVILAEVDMKCSNHSIDEKLTKSTPCLWHWNTSRSKFKWEKKSQHFIGSFKLIANNIIEHFKKVSSSRENQVRNDLKFIWEGLPQNVEGNLLQSFSKFRKTFKEATNALNMANIKNILKLQESFKEQGRFHRELSFVKDTEERRKIKTKIDEQARFRADYAARAITIIQKHELLGLFCEILQKDDSNLRSLLINWFESTIDKECSKVLDGERKKVVLAYDTYSNSRKLDSPDYSKSKYLEMEYYKAKKAYTDKSIGIENIWREIILNYESASLQNQDLPEMAAQYLMDGFVLELMDGDTGILCKKWTNKLFQTLQRKLNELIGKEAQVFVLSIMGTQSSGKSTLLNIMFGCKMRVSAGQCTKGIYIQLIKSEFDDRYDYVLILDTEGLRAPEFFGEQWSIWKDNRMATLAVLSADATIITAVNEDDTAIREVVPIVLLAHKRSKIATENSVRQPTKLFFAYNRVDTTNLSKFLENRQSLHRSLKDAERELADFGRQGYNFLDSFHTSEDESKSDIKYFGMLNKGDTPPGDTPNFTFGRKVASFREYIEEQTKSRNPQTLVKWNEHIQLVYDCLDTTNFELSFRSAMEHTAYNELENEVGSIEKTVAKAFGEAFSVIESEIMKSSVSTETEACVGMKETERVRKPLTYFEERFNNLIIQPVEIDASKKVDKIIQNNKYKSFRITKKQSFRHFIDTLKAQKLDKIKITYHGKFVYEAQKQEYQKRICEELKNEIGKDSSLKDDESRQEEIFEKIFAHKLEECERKYPGLDVRKEVEDIYRAQLGAVLKAPQNALGHKSEKGWRSKANEWFKGLFVGNQNSSKEEALSKLLMLAKFEELMAKSKSFDGGIVREIIRETTEATKGMSAADANDFHFTLKNLAIYDLQVIQSAWEKMHSIPAKLRAEKEILKDNFKTVICKEIFGKDQAIHQISSGLTHALTESYMQYVSEKVVIAVRDERWVGDWRILQAFVDLKYLELSKTGKVDELINELRQSKEFYLKTIHEKIGEVIPKYETDEWMNLIQKTCQAVDKAGLEASRELSHGYDLMKDVIKQELMGYVWKNVPELTTWDDRLNDDLSKPDQSPNLNFVEIKDAVIGRLMNIEKPTLDIQACKKQVYDLMGTRPRCTEVCPICRLPCNRSMGHYKREGHIVMGTRHTCDHQPNGLVGTHWDGSKKLCGFSCAESVSRGHTMKIDEKIIPYTDFAKQYPDWMLPSEASVSSRVRKYLFQVHNKALAQHYQLEESDKDNFYPWMTETIEDMVYETKEKIEKMETIKKGD